MSKLLLFFILIFINTQPVWSTVITGNNDQYAWQKLNFFCYSDPVTQQKEFLFSLEFDGTGHCKTTVATTKTIFAFADFGVYRGMLFISPGKNIELKLPPLRKKSFADEKNPFFEPVNFWFDTQNETDLTNQISHFEITFNKLTNQYLNQLYFQQSKAICDSVISRLNNNFPGVTSPVFQAHKKLTLKSLEMDVFRIKAEDVSAIFSTIDTSYWNHPAFISLFNKVFANKLSFEAKELKGTRLREAVASGNADFLLHHLRTKYKLTGELTKLALLKLLHDGFYSGDFAKASILKLLKSETLTKKSSITIRRITKRVVAKLTFLLPGTKAPVICLKDIDGNPQCSNQANGKFKYLIFADDEMVVCREHLKYLSKIEGEFQKYLQIILVMRKTELIAMKIFLIKNKIPGVKLIDENGEFIQKYKVKTFPACFLLNENHQVVFQQTKAPLDGFEQQFGAYLRKVLFEKQRKQAR